MACMLKSIFGAPIFVRGGLGAVLGSRDATRLLLRSLSLASAEAFRWLSGNFVRNSSKIAREFKSFIAFQTISSAASGGGTLAAASAILFFRSSRRTVALA